jgi:hypothetical protein
MRARSSVEDAQALAQLGVGGKCSIGFCTSSEMFAATA